ncbi:MAG TPA: hypothetical protein VH062_09885 [Polyangiaceae bacterium]|jgi:hypothetical protein|nr:hypothetical protein [Polyangiaceae bacterium]
MASIRDSQAYDKLRSWYDVWHREVSVSSLITLDRFFDEAENCAVFSAVDDGWLPFVLESYDDDENDDGDVSAWNVNRRTWCEGRPALSADDLASLRANFIKPKKCAQCGTGYRFRAECPDCTDVGPDIGSHTQIIEDRHTIFPGGDWHAFAVSYARSVLPVGWNTSVLVCLKPGKPVIVVRWTPELCLLDVTYKVTDSWDSKESSPRWFALENESVGSYRRHWIKPSTVEMHSDLAGFVTSRKPKGAPQNQFVPIGITALNSSEALKNGGVPLRGARCIIQGLEGSGKSTLLVEVAAGYVAQGKRAVIIASGDETAESFAARWYQRQGMSRDEALAKGNDGVLADGKLLIVDGRELTLEDAYNYGGFEVLLLDPLQKISTRAGADADPVRAVREVLKVVETHDVTVWATSAVTRGSDKRRSAAASYGGAVVENSATLLLNASLADDGETMTVEVLKSRYGRKGGKVELRLDADGQRVGPLESEVWLKMRAALLGGPLTRSELAARVGGRKADALREIRERVEAGDIAEAGERVQLTPVPRTGTA